MAAKVRRIDSHVIAPFDWQGRAGGAMPQTARAAAEPAVDVQAQQINFADLERDAFAKGFAQGERAGAEAAAKRGEAMLRRLTQTLEEITGLREQMIKQTEEQMVRLALAVARRVVHREVTLDRDLLVAMARKWRREGGLPVLGPLSALLVSVWLWMVYSSIDPLMVYMIPALHSIQYLYFVWLLRRNEAREQEGPPSFGRPAAVRVGILAASAVALGLIWMVISSYIMWYRLPTKRRGGIVALMLGFATCAAFVAGLRWLG